MLKYCFGGNSSHLARGEKPVDDGEVKKKKKLYGKNPKLLSSLWLLIY